MAIKKIGHIVNTYGIKGMVKISISSSTPENRFAVGKKIILKNELNEDQTYVIKTFLQKNSRIVYIGLEGYDDINKIEWMIGRDVFSDVRPPKGTFFYDELVGMNVIDPDGKTLGTVENVVTMPAGDYLQVNGALIPFKMPLFVDSADRKTKEIHLTQLGSESYQSSK